MRQLTVMHSIIHEQAFSQICISIMIERSRILNNIVFLSGDGRMVIGSKSGSVHLYAAEPLRQWTIATTDFNTGAPITHLDITYDGHWILATTDHYLVVAPTQFRVGPC